MSFGYCCQHSPGSFRAQIYKLKKQTNECSSAFEAIINLTSQGKDNYSVLAVDEAVFGLRLKSLLSTAVFWYDHPVHIPTAVSLFV